MYVACIATVHVATVDFLSVEVQSNISIFFFSEKSFETCQSSISITTSSSSGGPGRTLL